jgi:hypothetical protein
MAKSTGNIEFNIEVPKGKELTEQHIKDSLEKLAKDHNTVKKLKDHFATSGSDKATVIGTKKQGN